MLVEVNVPVIPPIACIIPTRNHPAGTGVSGYKKFNVNIVNLNISICIVKKCYKILNKFAVKSIDRAPLMCLYFGIKV